jgi:hypothetical protein
MDLNDRLKKKILKSLGKPKSKSKINFKYQLTWLGVNEWCIEVDPRAHYDVKDLLVDNGLTIDVIPSGYGHIAGLYQLREI